MFKKKYKLVIDGNRQNLSVMLKCICDMGRIGVEICDNYRCKSKYVLHNNGKYIFTIKANKNQLETLEELGYNVMKKVS